MMRRVPFLTAQWRRLVLLSYDVDPEAVARVCPRGLEPDTRDGRAFVSLVAFDFLDTRVLGVPWPGFRNFPEINLRAYVRRPNRERGVVFVRELVPQALVAWLARALYNEPYRAARMASTHRLRRDCLLIAHEWQFGGARHRLLVEAAAAASTPPRESAEHWFKEHQWGFGRDRRGRTLRYEVRHPVWRVHAVRRWSLDADFGALYGRRWAFLTDREPVSVVLAEGSAISVFPAGGFG